MHTGWTATAIALLLAPTGAVLGATTSTEGTAVEQHTAFVPLIINANEDEGGQGLAAVAGIVACQADGPTSEAVKWFNDQILLERGPFGLDTGCLEETESSHVWLTEEEAPDPRDNPSLKATGTAYEFTDPNGQDWTVREFVYHQVHVHREISARVNAVGETVGVDSEGEIRAVPFYTWVVEISDPVHDPTIDEDYNFVTLVDFDKLQTGSDGHRLHTGESGGEKRGDSHNASDPDEKHSTPHGHDSVEVELRVGGPPEEGPGTPYENGARADARVVTPEAPLP